MATPTSPEHLDLQKLSDAELQQVVTIQGVQIPLLELLQKVMESQTHALEGQLIREQAVLAEIGEILEKTVIFLDENFIVRSCLGEDIPKMLGLSKAQIIGESFPKLVSQLSPDPYSAQMYTQLISRAMKKKEKITIRRGSDGSAYFQLEFVPSVQFSGVYLVVQNVTSNVQTERQLVTLQDQTEILIQEKTGLEQRFHQLKIREEQLDEMQIILEKEGTNVSKWIHELRGRFTAMFTAIAFLQEYYDRLSSEKIKDKINEVHNLAYSMLRLMTDLRTLDAMSSESFRNAPEIVSTSDLIKHLYQNSVYHEEVKLTLDFIFIDGVPESVLLDPFWLENMLHNLIDNAIKYNKNGGKVIITTLISNGNFIFEIKDTGIGVPADAQEHLFHSFYRADNARKLRVGSGLGLVLVRECAVMLGGVVTYEPNPDGDGSMFRLEIPLGITDSVSANAQ